MKRATRIISLLMWVAGCAKPTPRPVKPTVPPGPGVVQGVVHYGGPPVVPRQIKADCCPGAAPVVDESVVVGPTGGLSNVVVWIDNGPNVMTDPAKDQVLTQQDCRYIPHVMAVQTGRRILVTSHDPVPHNVHLQPQNNPEENFPEVQSTSKAVSFENPDDVRCKCDVHPWMTAYIKVFDHPCFFVTGTDGSFEIGRLPVGTYTVKAWHEKFGELTATAVVKDATPVTLNFEYKP